MSEEIVSTTVELSSMTFETHGHCNDRTVLRPVKFVRPVSVLPIKIAYIERSKWTDSKVVDTEVMTKIHKTAWNQIDRPGSVRGTQGNPGMTAVKVGIPPTSGAADDNACENQSIFG
jgi:hypothetical protein